MTEYKFLIFYVSFLGFMTFMLTLGAPIFSVPGVVTPPSPPDHWWEWPGFLLGIIVFFFKLLIIPEVPSELRILTFIVFLPAVIVFFWILIKFIAPVVAEMIPL